MKLLLLGGLLALAVQGSSMSGVDAWMTLPDHSIENCNQSSAGDAVGCSLNYQGAAAGGNADAVFGSLSVQAFAGSYFTSGAKSVASFDEDLTFESPGMVVGTWSVSYQRQGDILPSPPGTLIIMGQQVTFPTGQSMIPVGNFQVSIPFMYSGDPIDVSAWGYALDETPDSEMSSISLQLDGFSQNYNTVQSAQDVQAAEPPALLLALAGLALLVAARRMFLAPHKPL